MDERPLSLSLGNPVADYYARVSLGEPAATVEPKQQKQEAAPVATRPVVNTEPQQIFPEEQYNKELEDRNSKRAKAFAYISSQVLQLPKDQREIAFKSMKEYLDQKYPEIKPFNETIAVKSIMAELPAFEKKDDMILNIKGELEAASKISDRKDKMARLRTIIPKLIQSTGTGGADALQPAEVILGAPESQTFFTWAAANQRDISSPATWIAFFNDPAVQQSQIFEADPDKYIKKAKSVFNTFVDTRNERVNRYKEMTSGNWIKRNTGLKLFDKFLDADIDAEASAKQPAMSRANFDVLENGRVVRKDVVPTQVSQPPAVVQVPVPQPTAPRKQIKFVLKDRQLVPE